MAKKIKPYVPPPPEPVKPYVPQTKISAESKKLMLQEAVGYWDAQSKYYGWTEAVPPNVAKRLAGITAAVDLETAQKASEKAKGAIQSALLAAWAGKKIPGPDLPENWEGKAKKAESLAKWLDSIDNLTGAKQQYRKAEEYRERADKLRKELDAKKVCRV